MAGAAVPLLIAGTAVNVYGQYQRGRFARMRGAQEQARLQQEAGQEIASSQRMAIEEDRQSRLAQSRAVAVAAASGASATDPTVINIISRQAGEGAYRAAVSLYQGESKASSLRYAGAMADWAGRQEERASRFGMAGALLQGAGMYSRYGGGGPGGGGIPIIDTSGESGWQSGGGN